MKCSRASCGINGGARYGDLTGSPDESGSKRREKGLARAGNARVRRGMIQLAWRWLMFQNKSVSSMASCTCSARGASGATFPATYLPEVQ